MNREHRTLPTLFLSLWIALLPLEAQTLSRTVAVAPQYGTTHVYVAPRDTDAFVASFLGTFGGASTKQVVTTVTPTPSSTTSQLLQTPSGNISLFGFLTPIPYPFGSERTGLLVEDMDRAVTAARASGAEVVVQAFPDPIGRDAVLRFPGGLMTQIYWHTRPPSSPALAHPPENRIYVSPDAVTAFLHSYLQFSQGHVVNDEAAAPGAEIGRTNYTYRRIHLASKFGKALVMVTDGILPFPYGLETTGYEVDDLDATLKRATSFGAIILTPDAGAHSAMVRFPGGYIAEIHASPR